MTAYTYTIEKYGPLSWQHMVVGRPTGGSSGLYGHVICPGGGWGLRDAAAAVSTASSPSRSPLFAGAWDNSSSSSYKGATVFCLNVASESQNSMGIYIYESDPLLTSSTPSQLQGNGLYNSGTTYATNDVVYSAGNEAYISLQDSNTGNAVTDTAYWAEVPSCTPMMGRRPGGEGSPGSTAQSARDIQRAIAHIRRNADYYDVDPDKILLEGRSAGAQAAGLAAYSDPLPFGNSTHATAGNLDTPIADCRPNGLILGIAAFKQDEYAAVDKGTSSNSLFLSFMNSLHGRPGLTTWANWDALSPEAKKGLDPFWAAYTSGYYVPTFFQYDTDGGLSDIWTRSEMANGVASSDYSAWQSSYDYVAGDLVGPSGTYYYKCIQDHNSGSVAQPTTNSSTAYWAYVGNHAANGSSGVFSPEIHHSWNGRLYITEFTKATSAGGLGIPSTDIRLSLRDGTNKYGDPDTVRIYNGAPTTEQYNVSTADKEINMVTSVSLSGLTGLADRSKPLADEIVSFFTGSILTKYMS